MACTMLPGDLDRLGLVRSAVAVDHEGDDREASTRYDGPRSAVAHGQRFLSSRVPALAHRADVLPLPSWEWLDMRMGA